MSLKRAFAIKTFTLRYFCVELVKMRFGRLNESQKAYRLKIVDSGLFDKDHYVYQRPRCWISKRMPLRHFILRGEKMGLSPSGRFNPERYLHANPDVRSHGMGALQHYLEFGKEERRRLKVTQHSPADKLQLAIPQIERTTPRSGRAVAVMVHLFYCDLWPDILRSIGNLGVPFDLLVTITRREGFESILHTVQSDRPDAMIWVFPNHGRDIFPFIHLLNSGMLDGYEAVCKLHTKKSPHRRDGEAWRKHLMESILPTDGAADLLVQAILGDPSAGLIAADGQISTGDQFWGRNKYRCHELLRQIRINPDHYPLRFPLGSIFWVTRPVLDRLRELRLQSWQFEPEHGQLDGTLAHAVERVLGVIALASGLRVDSCSYWKSKQG